MIGAFLGIVLGYIFIKVDALKTMLMPYLIFLQTAPKIALVPLFVIWFGIGLVSKVVLIISMVLFPVLSGMMLGLESIPPDVRNLMKILKASKWQIFSQVEMQYSLPALFASMKVGIVQAVIGAIDREGFVNTLMEGNGSVAEGPFPSYFAFGDSKVQEESYDLEYSRELLAEAGWTDEDGDGYVEKDGKRLTICWLTYPSRQELPLLAESAQASLKKIGIEVQIQCTANHLELLKKGNWDVYVSAFVSAPTGDPEYFFTTHCLQDSSKNRGGYYSETLEMLEQQLSGEFDTEKRTELAIEMTQTLLDDHMFFFASHLKMSMVSGEGVTGLTAHPCDYYEITVNLDKNK